MSTSIMTTSRTFGLSVLIAASFSISSIASAKTLTWNGVDGAEWSTTATNWLEEDGVTESAWVEGANAVFPAAASVTLVSPVSVSNLTTSAALTITGTAVVTYNTGFVPSANSTLIFPQLKLSDLAAVTAKMTGKSILGGAEGTEKDTAAYHFTINEKTASAQFQAVHGVNILCVKAVFSEETDGIYAKVVSASYKPYVNGSTASANIGIDIDAVNATPYKTTISRDKHGYGLIELKAMTARVVLSGEAKLGGALSFSSASIDVIAPIAQKWTHPISCINGGRLTVKGLASEAKENTFGILDPNVGGAAAAWLTENAADNVFTNAFLSRMIPVRAVMRGGYISYNGVATIHHIKYNGETMTFQVQHNTGQYIKGSLVKLKQSGANVTAQVEKTYLYTLAEGETNGIDLEAKGADAEPGKYSIQQYGVKSITFSMVEVPSLTVDAANNVKDAIIDNAVLILGGTVDVTIGSSSPMYVLARNKASVIYSSALGYNGSGGGSHSMGIGMTKRFESGSSLFVHRGLVTKGQGNYIFDSSTFCNPMWHSTNKDGNNYINELTLANGSIYVGNPLRSGYNSVTNETHYLSIGDSKNVIESGINMLKHGSSGLDNVVVLTTDADLEIKGAITDSPNTAFAGSQIVKRGAAMLTLSGANTFAGRITVEAGTLVLGSDDALPESAPITFKGGTLECGAFANATGALTVSGNATINLGNGSISFADSSAETWTEGMKLNIIGPESLKGNIVRFGTSAAALTLSQRKAIRYNGKRVTINADGYLRGPKGLVVCIH